MTTQQESQNRVVDLERQLKLQEERFRSFLSLTRQAYCLIEFDHPISTKLPPAQQASFMLAARLVDCNDEFAQIYQAGSAADLIGARFVSLILATEKFILRARRFVSSGYRLTHEEIERPMHDGSVKSLIANVIGEIQDGWLTRVWITMQDVSLQRLAEQFANQGKSALEGVNESQDSAFWMMDWDAFQVIYVGPAFEKIWHISEQELHNDPLSWLNAVHPDDRKRVEGAFLTQVSRGTYDETFRLTRADDSIRIIRDRGFPIVAGPGQVERVVGLATDVTEPWEARVGLDHFFDSCAEMLTVINADGRLREANAAFYQTTGYAAEELAHRDLLDLVHEDDRNRTQETVALLNRGVAAVDLENRIRCRDGDWKTFLWNIAPVTATGSLYATAREQPMPIQKKASVDLSKFSLLTPREVQVMHLIVDGRTNKSMALELGISQRTVEKHRQRVMSKLEIDNVPDLVRMAMLWGN